VTRTIGCTILALVAFAANSVLCRLALRDLQIDAATFSSLRLAAGAGTLALVVRRRGRRASGVSGAWGPAILFLYAVPFSFAYLQLTTGTGALILFAGVQLTMIAGALAGGERLHVAQWFGLGTALAGLVYLVRPGLTAPAPLGAALMAVAGVGWGAYSLMGRGEPDPLARNASNFARAVPLALLVNVLALPQFHLEGRGALLAIVSGSLASGIGYVVWYVALAGLTATRAAVVQLGVPVLASVAGIVLLGEPATLRLALSAVAVLGGIALAIVTRTPQDRL
jgi:drug/metabolite transporter (DMT)-like permease